MRMELSYTRPFQLNKYTPKDNASRDGYAGYENPVILYKL